MAFKQLLKTNYEIESKCDAFFTGRYIEITNDGEHIFCECDDNVSVVNVETGNIESRITCDEDHVTGIALSPDNTNIVIALKSGNVQQYEWPSRKSVRSFKSYHKGPITCMKWDNSSTLLLTGGSDSSARIWDLRQKFCTHNLKADGVFRVVLFDHDLTKEPYAYGAAANNIYRWKLNEGSSTLLTKYEGHHGQVTSVQITPDSQQLISSSFDRVLILWSVDSGSSMRVIPVMDSISSMLLKPPNIKFPNAKDDLHIYVMTVGDKGLLSVWQVDEGKEVWRASEATVQCTDNDGVTLVPQMLYNKSLKSVVLTTYENSIIFAHCKSMISWKQLAGYNEQVLDCIFVGEENSHLAVATNSQQLRLYNCENKSCQFVKGHSAIPLSLTRHPKTCSIFASSSHDNSIRVWKLLLDERVVCIAVATGHLQSVGGVAFGQDFIISGSKDLCLKKWTFSKDLLESITSSPISLTASHTAMDHDKDINSICVAINNKLVASGSQDRTAKVWDASSLSVLGVLKGHRRGIWCVQFSPVDEILATSSADAEIKIWSLSDYSNVKTLQGHDAGVLRLGWLSHGLQLISTASDGLIKLWTIKTGICTQTYDEHDDKTWAMAVSSDEQKIVTGGEDAALLWWKDVTKDEAQKAQEEMIKLASEEQSLLNLMQQGKWTKAIAIAIRLNQPYRALKILKEIIDKTPYELSNVVNKLREDQLSSLLQFCVQWNTKTKSSREAQSIVHLLLKERSPEELELIPEWRTTLEGLLPYTERHYHRIASLTQASSILQYMTTQLALGIKVQNTMPLPQSSIKEEKYENEDSLEFSDDDSSNEELLTEVKDSIMEVSDNESELNYQNGDEMNMSFEHNKIESLEGLENNYEFEKVVVESSDEEETSSLMETNTDKPNKHHFSADQLRLPTKLKQKNINNNNYNRKGKKSKSFNNNMKKKGRVK